MKRVQSARPVASSKIAKRAQSDLTRADYKRLAEFRYLLRRFLVFSEKAAQRAGLTAQQHQGLLAIKGYRGQADMTTGELAERLAIRHHSAVGLIDRLVAKGLVDRRSGADDRRQVLLSLTPKAEALLTTLSIAHRDELERLAPLLQALLGYFERDREDGESRTGAGKSLRNTAAKDRSGR
jgi:DNA-binding MarR family transcriptional regulator